MATEKRFERTETDLVGATSILKNRRRDAAKTGRIVDPDYRMHFEQGR